MKTNRLLILAFAISLFLSFSSISGFSQVLNNDHYRKANTSGNMTFTVRTVESGGNYAPKHVLAIWIEDDNGFVKTRLARANNRKQYLYMWRAASNYNVTDAITGATLSSHITHTVSWDCKDLNGMEVADGNYHVYVEFTDKHAQGPFKMLTFIKGPEPQHIQPFNETYFKDMDLEWVPDGVGFDENVVDGGLVVYPNPSQGIFRLKGGTENSILKVYSSSGKLVMNEKFSEPYGDCVIDLRKQPTGIYLIEVTGDRKRYVQNILKQ